MPWNLDPSGPRAGLSHPPTPRRLLWTLLLWIVPLLASPVAAAATAAPAGEQDPGQESAATPDPDPGPSEDAPPVTAQPSQPEPAAETGAAVGLGPGGLTVTSPDGRHSLRLRGYAQGDGRAFIDGGEDRVLLRRARPTLEIRSGRFGLRLGAALEPGRDGELLDAWFEYFPEGSVERLRFGRFKVPFGIERLLSGSRGMFPERSLADNLVPDRDFGVTADLEGGAWTWQVALMDGVQDRGIGDGDSGDGLTGVVRTMVSPVATGPWSGLGVGAAVTYGRRSEEDGLPSWRTSGRARIFEFRDQAVATGEHLRVSPQAEWTGGPGSALAEWVLSSYDVAVPGPADGLVEGTVDQTGGQLALGWVLTGEDASFRGVRPAHDFDPGSGHWGAFEVTGRVHFVDADETAFPRFADPAEAVERAEGITLGLRWYLSSQVRVLLAADHTTFEGGAPAGGDREDETVVIGRLQLAF